jgi:hypothetical protein
MADGAAELTAKSFYKISGHVAYHVMAMGLPIAV